MSLVALLIGLTPVSFAIPQQLTQQPLARWSGAAIEGQHNLVFESTILPWAPTFSRNGDRIV